MKASDPLTIYDRIRQANADAQTRFAAMLDAGTVADPYAIQTRAYIGAERILDRLILDAQWAVVERETSALFDAVHPPDDDQSGDHHVYPNGVGR